MFTPSFFPTLVKRLLGRRRQARTGITPEMKAEARASPDGGWLYEIRGTFGPNDDIPFKAIAGWWRTDPSGNIIEGSYQANPDFEDTGVGGGA